MTELELEEQQELEEIIKERFRALGMEIPGTAFELNNHKFYPVDEDKPLNPSKSWKPNPCYWYATDFKGLEIKIGVFLTGEAAYRIQIKDDELDLKTNEVTSLQSKIEGVEKKIETRKAGVLTQLKKLGEIDELGKFLRIFENDFYNPSGCYLDNSEWLNDKESLRYNINLKGFNIPIKVSVKSPHTYKIGRTNLGQNSEEELLKILRGILHRYELID